jgi:Toprim-like/CHC2 zinc finger
MNIKQANTISLIDLLTQLGFKPDRIALNGTDLWYKSPLRTEDTASFHVNKNKNIWYDFGASEGGSVVDFVVKLKLCDVSAALNFIENTMSQPIQKAEKKPEILRGGKKSENEAFTLLKTSSEFSPASTQYLQERKINVALIRDYAVEVHFKNQKGKTFFGIGMKNLSEGYEIRNAYFKGNVGAKDLTFVKGIQNDTLAIFEGMFDFFSAITHFGKTFLENDVLILNSVAFQDQAAAFIKDRPHYQKLSLFLDNDTAGTETATFFQTEFADKIIEPSFALYLRFKDFNEFLVK